MKRIRNGIHQLVSPFPQYTREEAYRFREEEGAQKLRHRGGLPYVLPYFIASQGENLLVDCGWATDDSFAALQEQLREIGSDPSEISTLALTHGHPDHCGLTERLRSASECRVLMHEREVRFLAERASTGAEMRRDLEAWAALHGIPPGDLPPFGDVSAFLLPSIEPDRSLQQGDQVTVGEFVFEVIWTPGHSPGHICFYEANHKLLLTGDHVLPVITPNISVQPYHSDNPLAEYLDSLARISHLKVARMLPAHEWDIDSFQDRMEKLRDHHLDRLEEMLGIVREQGSQTAWQVASKVAWSAGSYDKFPSWIKWAAIGETLAHLRYLVHQNRLREVETDGRVYFQKT